jgi:hypothetical protein
MAPGVIFKNSTPYSAGSKNEMKCVFLSKKEDNAPGKTGIRFFVFSD